MIDLNRLHSRPFIFAAFLASIALGGWASVQRRGAVQTEAAHLVPALAAHCSSPDPAAASVGAMPLFREACAERARGHYEVADVLLARLSDSPDLNAAEKAYCRKAKQTLCAQIR